MQNIGTALVFFLKYYDEMERLYDEEKTLPVVETRLDKEAIYKKIQTVGTQAGSDAADLITTCMAELQEQLQAINGIELRTNQRGTIERDRGIEISVFADKKKSNGVRRQLGLLLDRDELVPWVWSRGGREAEGPILRLLGAAASPSCERDFTAGAVTLRATSIDWRTATGFQLDARPVIEEVQKTLRILTPEFITEWLREE